MEIEKYKNLMDRKRQKLKEMLSLLDHSYRVNVEYDEIVKEMTAMENTIFRAPEFLTRIEKIIYYFNRTEGLTLQEIADTMHLSMVYVCKISARVSKKIKL
jgi:DNA-directed RNA polymerase specialized sigma subunit